MFLVSESGLISRKTGGRGGSWGSPGSSVFDNDNNIHNDEENENENEDHDKVVEKDSEETLSLPLLLYAGLFRFVVSTARTIGLGRIEEG